MRGLGPGPGPDAGPGRSRLQPGHYRRHGGPGLRLQAQSGLLRGFWSSRAAGFGGHGAAHPLGQPRLAGDRGTPSGATSARRPKPTPRAMFRSFGGFDAVTVNAWGGRDSVAPFLQNEDKGVFVWGPRLQPRLRRFSGPGNRRRSAVPAYGINLLELERKGKTSGWWSARLSPKQLAIVRAEMPGKCRC